jgi:uncharacterized protein YjfI (DUF2170 family)
MNAKSSAHYQREYRKRLREQGLVKKEVWVRPENTRLLSSIEKQLRGLQTFVDINEKTGVNVMTNNLKCWTTLSLYQALMKSELFLGTSASIEMIEGVDPAIHITLHDFGDLPVFLTVYGEQIIVESVLWPVLDINDVPAFNEMILRTHKYFPLSTISLDTMSDGVDYYHMFGALSSTSILDNVIFEIEVLGSNVIQATSAYSSFLSLSAEA